MRKLTVGRRVVLGFVATLLLSLASSVFNVARLQSVDVAADRIVRDCLPGVFTISQIASCVKENKALVQHHVLSEGEGLKQKLGSLIATNLTSLTKLTRDYEATITQPSGRELYARLQKAREPFDRTFAAVLDNSTEGNGQAAMELLIQQLTPQYDAYLQALEAQVSFNHDQGGAASAAIVAAVGSTRRATLIGLTLSIALSIAAALVVIAGINRVLRRISHALVSGAGNMSRTAGNLTTGSRELADAANIQAASLQQTSASTQQSASMAKRNADSAQSATLTTRETRKSAESSRESIAAMKAAVEGINVSSQELGTAMEDIRVSSRDIAKIVSTINEIAFQTNILALNAAVEAARAGESGLGFAVVADEVRRLAQRSATAAQETGAIIETTIRKTEFAVEVTHKVARALVAVDAGSEATAANLQDILDRVRQVDEFVAGIAAASGEQSNGLQQISRSIHRLEEVTTANAGHAARSLDLAGELNQQSDSLGSVLGELLMLTGQGSPGPDTGPQQATPSPLLPTLYLSEAGDAARPGLEPAEQPGRRAA